MSRKRVIALVAGSVVALVAFALIAAGAVAGWAAGTQRDDAGYFNTSTDRYSSPTRAITSADVNLGDPQPSAWWSDNHILTVRVSADSAGEHPVFLGIASREDVDAYLRGVAHDEVASVRFDPFRPQYRQVNADGAATLDQPTEQTLWVASASGTGEQTVTWDVRPGRWVLVIMNADASSGIAADVRAGVQIDYIVQLSIGLVAAGLLTLAVAAMLIIPSVREHDRRAAATAPAPVDGAVGEVHAPTHPVQVVGLLDAPLSRWKWLVKWLLSIPHFIVLAFLWIAFVVLTVIAFFSILFTKRYPRSIFEFNVGVLRWTWRVTYFCTSVMGTDRYPPFTLEDTDYPATLRIVYPNELSRGLVLVKSWLLALPQLVIVGILTSATTISGGNDGWSFAMAGGLVGALTIVAAVTLMFTGRYPTSLHDLLVGLDRWVIRVIAYVALMTDEYPPFRLDQGPDEPTSPNTPGPNPVGTSSDSDVVATREPQLTGSLRQ